MAKLSWALLPVSIACWLWALFRIYPDATVSLNTGATVSAPAAARSRSRSADDPGPYPNDSADNVFYFAQISDLHVSHHKHGHLANLRLFLQQVLPTIQPEFVVVTGDLTDAKEKKRWGSHQYQSEWEAYEAVLREHGVLDRAGFWWDQRGNHDCFAVSGWDSGENFFRRYSVTKEDRYGFVFKRPYGSYSFIGLDACPVYGPGRPFNFFGYFDTADMNYLQQRLLDYSPSSNHTFVMSHYPISTTMTGFTSDGASFSQLAQHFSVFLCGHLHKLAGGLGNMLHAHHPENFLELELADMKENGFYRIVAVDHDLISFADAPVTNNGSTIVITNPKDARYILPQHEPTSRIRRSSHIRWLTFGKNVGTTRVGIDGVLQTNAVMFIGRDKNMPLYAMKWDPLLYDDGQTHRLEITVTDARGYTSRQLSQFRVDNQRPELNIGPGEYIMSARIFIGVRFLFIVIYIIITVGLLLTPKLISFYLHRYRKYHRWRVSYSRKLISMDRAQLLTVPPATTFAGLWTRLWLSLRTIYTDFLFFVHATTFRLVTLASLSRTFYPLYCYGLYILVGPYFIGELIPAARQQQTGTSLMDALGSFYLYGVYVEHRWIPMADTWLFGLFELMYIYGPMVVYLSFCITPAEQLYAPRPARDPAKNQVYFPHRHDRRRFPLHRRLSVRLLVGVVVFYQFITIFFIGFCYGPWAALLSPSKTWFILWSCYALFKHRWSWHGREIDLLTEAELKRMYKGTVPRSPVMMPSSEGAMFANNDQMHIVTSDIQLGPAAIDKDK